MKKFIVADAIVLQAEGLVVRCRDRGPFTVIASIDDVFVQVPKGNCDSVLTFNIVAG